MGGAIDTPGKQRPRRHCHGHRGACDDGACERSDGLDGADGVGPARYGSVRNMIADLPCSARVLCSQHWIGTPTLGY